MQRRRIATADEQDVHTSWRRWYTRYQRAGMTKRVKQATNRRERTESRRTLRAGREDLL